MSDQVVDTLEEPNNQNTNTEELNVLNDNDNNNDDVVYSHEDEHYEVDDRLSVDDIDSMTDEEFAEYLNGKSTNVDIKEKEDPQKQQEEEEEKESEPEPQQEEKGEKVQEDSNDSKKNTSVVNKEVKKEESTKQDLNQDDIKAAYEAIFKPFKANGKEIAPKTVDDVISLMQMGANYTKKMQLMAPMKRSVESLNKAGITDTDLNFLIDVHNGDKEAIKKLLEKHKVDPIDLDMENTNYVPKNNIVSDSDIEYANILEDIQPSLPKIQKIITEQWDPKSKEYLLKDPQLMKALHEEIEMGRFDKVQTMVEMEKTFGRAKEKSDLEIYIDLVSKIAAAEQNTAISSNTKKSLPDQTVTKPIPDKTKAAPVRTKQSNQGTPLSEKDLFSLSDEEFMKLSERGLI